MQKQLAHRDRSRGALIASLVLVFAARVFGQDAATVALEKTNLAAALKSADSLVRATAARVAMVRNNTELVAQLRDVLAAEKEPAAAREEIRALVLLGSDDDVAFAAAQLPRFPVSTDTDFGEAVARLGAPRSTALYLKHVVPSRDPSPSVRLALWGRTSLASATASQFLAARLDQAYGAVLYAAKDASLQLDAGVITAGLSSTSPKVVSDTIWYLVELYAFEPAHLPESLRERATATREHAPAFEELGREILRRMLGAKPVSRPELLELLATKDVQQRILASKDVRRYLTEDELRAMGLEDLAPPDALSKATHPSQSVTEPEFRLPIVLPGGLAAAILKKKRCSDLWIGVAKATVDRAGRVQALDVGDVGVSGGCKDALTAMLELSLATPAKITSPLASANQLLVKPRGRSGCFDENAPDNAIGAHGLLRAGGEVEAPKIKKRIEPVFPESVRGAMGGGSTLVIAESVITRTGCVREIRLLRQSQWPLLNSAAVLALSEWTFEPGQLDGVPVDVIFNLTVNFKIP